MKLLRSSIWVRVGGGGGGTIVNKLCKPSFFNDQLLQHHRHCTLTVTHTHRERHAQTCLSTFGDPVCVQRLLYDIRANSAT